MGLEGGGTSNSVASHGECVRSTNREHSSQGAASKGPRGSVPRATRIQSRVGLSFPFGATCGWARHLGWCCLFPGGVAGCGAWTSTWGLHLLPGGGRRGRRVDPVRAECPHANCYLRGNHNCCIQHRVWKEPLGGRRSRLYQRGSSPPHDLAD